jgi:hypothetical protein
MAKDAVATMGEILPDDVGGRDAVHVAVISAIAGTRLYPGRDVGLLSSHAQTGEIIATGPTDAIQPIGIVDPFIKNGVEPNQRFWLYLYPRSITSLRHNWTHPAFPDAVDGKLYAPPSQKLASQQWLDNYARQFGYTGEKMIEAATGFLQTGDYLCDGGTFEGIGTPDEFWDHYETVTGNKIAPDDKSNFFTCSC